MDEAAISPASENILLIDNEQFIVVAYRDGLERAGYKVTLAEDGQSALDQMLLDPPNLVLLELLVPKLNGFELIQAMKQEPKLLDIPILVLTNLSQQADREEAESLGAQDFFVKSDVSLQDVLKRINSLLGYA